MSTWNYNKKIVIVAKMKNNMRRIVNNGKESQSLYDECVALLKHYKFLNQFFVDAASGPIYTRITCIEEYHVNPKKFHAADNIGLYARSLDKNPVPRCKVGLSSNLKRRDREYRSSGINPAFDDSKLVELNLDCNDEELKILETYVHDNMLEHFCEKVDRTEWYGASREDIYTIFANDPFEILFNASEYFR